MPRMSKKRLHYSCVLDPCSSYVKILTVSSAGGSTYRPVSFNRAAVALFCSHSENSPHLLRNPFNPQPLISHLTNSNGCGNLQPRSADSVPVSSFLFPATPCVSAPYNSNQTNSCASYHIPATPMLPCNYKLFPAMANTYPPHNQQLPHSFHAHRGWHPKHHDAGRLSAVSIFRSGRRSANDQSLCFQRRTASYFLLPLFSRLPSFVFNRLQPLFAKHPGWVCRRSDAALPTLSPSGFPTFQPSNLPRSAQAEARFDARPPPSYALPRYFQERACWFAILSFGSPPSAASQIPSRGAA